MSVLEQKMREFAATFPVRPASRPTSTWLADGGLCGISMIQFNGWLGGATAADIRNRPTVAIVPFWAKAPTGPVGTATQVSQHSGALNRNSAAAPIGAFHFWANNHVAQDADGGGTKIFMASTTLQEQISSGGLGFAGEKWYTSKHGTTYLGWSTNYSGGIPKLPSEVVTGLTGDQVRVLSAYLNSRAKSVGLPGTTAVSDGKPGTAYWRLVQTIGHADGLYPSPAYKIDGIPGPKSLELEQHYYAVATTPVTPPPPPPVETPDPPADPPATDDPPADPPVVDDPPATDDPQGPGEGDVDPDEPPVVTPSKPKPSLGVTISAIIAFLIGAGGAIVAALWPWK